MITIKDTYAHCDIPCGVYDDTMRVKMIEEHTLTILKSMNYISMNQNDLEKQNQVTRWIINKEQHAQEIQDIVSEYFLTQRIKLKDESQELRSKTAFKISSVHISGFFFGSNPSKNQASIFEMQISFIAF